MYLQLQNFADMIGIFFEKGYQYLIMEKFKKIDFDVSQNWKFRWNHFYDIDPDNDFNPDDVWDYFVEDILYMDNSEYFIDLGFYGGYLSNNREGCFVLVFAKGDFKKGILFEKILSRSVDEIKAKVDFCCELLNSKKILSCDGYQYDEDSNRSLSDFDLYSSFNKIQIKLSKRKFSNLIKFKKLNTS